MRYLGSKDSLAGQIMDLLRNKGLLQSELIFCDGFCGMGSVADSVKNIYKQIHSCPEKFYHSVSCLGPSPSGTLVVRSV